MKVLEVQNLSVQYHTGNGRKKVLDKISLSVKQGETAGIVGESGSGKSTAMLAVMGLLPENAEVTADEISVSGQRVIPGRDIAMVLQDSLSCLNPAVKIGRQITETIRAHKKCTRQEAKERAEELLEMAGIRDPKLRMRQYPFELSGGMRQRTAIAIALACEPKLIIADEPTTALDAAVQAQILRLLKRIVKDTDTSLLVVSHDMGVIAALCGRVFVMQSGRIIEQGAAEEIFYSPQQEYTKKLLRDTRGNRYLPAGSRDGEILLRLEHVTKVFGTKDGIRDISFDIRRGEVYALAGESGSGKTTLARILTGLLKPDSGVICYKGEKVEAAVSARACRGKIQMVFQDPYGSLNPCLTAGQALSEALKAHGEMTSGERRKKAEEMLSLVGLSSEDADRYPEEFSGGERQRIGIARALISEPQLLICDEALSALDTATRSQILKLILSIQRKKGIACLFISHDLPLIRKISSRISVLYRGRMAESGDTKEVCTDPWHPYTKLLLNAVPRPDLPTARKARPVLPAETVRGKEREEGCPFAELCGYTMECCRSGAPGLYSFGRRKIACFLYSEEHTGRRTKGYRMTSQI